MQTSPTQIEESNGGKKHFVIPVLPQTPPAPSSLSGISSEKRAVCCSQQVSADTNETCKTTQNAPLSADKGSKVRKLTLKKKNRGEKKIRTLDGRIKWNFYCTGLAGPMLDVLPNY